MRGRSTRVLSAACSCSISGWKSKLYVMGLLVPDPNQSRPTSKRARAMCQQVRLEHRQLNEPRLDLVLSRLRETHTNGGALFASFQVGPSEDFDWFASRDRLLEFGILRQLLDRDEISNALPELQIQKAKPENPAFSVRRLKDVLSPEQLAEVLNSRPSGPLLGQLEVDEDYEIAGTESDEHFQVRSSFLFDGELAKELYAGGAYTTPQGDGRAEKEGSLAFCEALFSLRFSEVWHCVTYSDWTPWFANVTGDWTAVLFDRRLRALSILATTDSD